jgi:hypothetical protein
MVDIRASLRGIVSKFDSLSGFVNEEFRKAGSALQEEVAAITTYLVDNAMRPIVGHYIKKFGKKGFNRLANEDRDLVGSSKSTGRLTFST